MSQLPQGCKEVKDAATGFTRIDCGTAENTCFAEPESAREACKNAGGTPRQYSSADNCPRTVCTFDGLAQPNTLFFKDAKCPAQDLIDSQLAQCKEKGLQTSLQSGLNGCSYVSCSGSQQNQLSACEPISSDAYDAKLKECKGRGQTLQPMFDAHGCKKLECASQQAACYNVPASAFEACKSSGGEMKILKDDSGCDAYSNCVYAGNEAVSIDAIEKVPDVAELQAVSADLQDLHETFAQLSEKAKLLGDYYASQDDAPNKEKFAKVEARLGAIAKKLTAISENLYADKASLLEVRRQLREIREVTLQDIMDLMLSPATKAHAGSDCGANDACLKAAYRLCEPAKASHLEAGIDFAIEINGLEGASCKKTVTATIAGKEESMTCLDPGYASDAFAESGFEKYCQGSLVEKLKATTNGA